MPQPFDTDPSSGFPHHPQAPLPPPQPRGFWAHWVESYNFLFRDPQWMEKSVFVPLAQLVPVLGWMVLLGWHMQLMHSLCRGEGVPAFDWRRIFRLGAQMFALVLLHLVLAAGLCALVWWSGWLSPEHLGYGRHMRSFWEFVVQMLLLLLLFGILWMLVLLPLLQAATVRWLLHGRWSAALDPLANAALLVRHIGAFMRLLPHALLSWLVLALAIFALSFTLLGMLLAPVALTLHYASDAYDMSRLIAHIRAREAAS